MQRRTYGILAGGALITTLGLGVVHWLSTSHQARLEQGHLEHVAERICRALEASHHYFEATAAHDAATRPAAGGAPAAQPSPDLLEQLEGLGLSPAAAPPTIANGSYLSNRSARSAIAATSSPAARSLASQLPSTTCLQEPDQARLRMVPDPADATVLWLTPDTPPGHGAARSWLKFAIRAIQVGGHDPGDVRLTPVADATVATAAREPRAALRFDGQTLLLDIRPEAPSLDPAENLDGPLLVVPVALLLGSLTAWLGYRSEQASRQRNQLLDRLWQDRQTGLLSRVALEQDIQTLTSKPQHHLPRSTTPKETTLLVVVTLRLLERQRAFLPDGEISRLFRAASEAVKHHALTGQRVRCYRASENRLAAILVPEREEPCTEDAEACRAFDLELLDSLKGSVTSAIQEQSTGLLRDDDIVVTGQGLVPGQHSQGLLELHGYGEIVATEAGMTTRLLDPGDVLQVRQTTAIRDALRQLRAEDLQLQVQPILQLASPGKIGLEALIRFRHPVLRNQQIGELIRIAHDLGITHHIDALVIGEVAVMQRQLETTPKLADRVEYISVNISIDSLSNPSRVDGLIACLRQHAIDPSRICLELTETPGRSNHTASVSAASERLIRELNFRIHIDDFGSGLSNYQRICDAWYDSIKLDIDLVSGLGDSLRMQRYLGSFIDTVHSLGKTVVAEGIDDHGDIAAAIRLGVDAIQGFLIARPMPWEEVGHFLQESPWAQAQEIEAMVIKLRTSDRLLTDQLPTNSRNDSVPLERYILDRWFELRSFEEFLLLFVNELKSWGLDIHRLSLAFLPDEDDIDCSQYVWYCNRPGDVTTLRMDRSFLEREEHLCSPLHHIATQTPIFRQRLASSRETIFPFLVTLKQQHCTDYLGIRLDSRGISIPVLTIALRGESSFSDEQIQRICSMSSLLSLLFYTFESERAKRMALLDPLTDLPNRRSYDSFLRSQVTAARIHGRPLALALVDIDRFKQVNDTLGHAYGDSCLKQVASILASTCRRGRDVAARLGGEEFALILPSTTPAEALDICERMRAAVMQAHVPNLDGGDGLPLSVSLGVALWDPGSSPECDGDQLQQLADDCLYDAKRQGRNRVVGRHVDP